MTISYKKIRHWLTPSKDIEDQTIQQSEWMRLSWPSNLEVEFCKIFNFSSKSIPMKCSQNTNKPYFWIVFGLFTSFLGNHLKNLLKSCFLFYSRWIFLKKNNIQIMEMKDWFTWKGPNKLKQYMQQIYCILNISKSLYTINLKCKKNECKMKYNVHC